jgi:hypothetical protein
MRPGSHAQTPSVFEVVRRAVGICDPDATDEPVADFLLAYEDRDEPVTALGDREREFYETAERIAGALPAPALQVAAAVATYLAFRRDELGENDEELLLLAARAEYGENPPQQIVDWLAAAGVAV